MMNWFAFPLLLGFLCICGHCDFPPDADECVSDDAICGPDASCRNSVGSYTCTCLHGYQQINTDMIAGIANPCTDIDECKETPDICGKQAVCTNAAGTFYCSCPDRFYPSTGVWWMLGVSVCKDLQEILDEIKPPKGQTKEKIFLGNMEKQLKENEGRIVPEPNVINIFSACMEAAGVGPRARKIKTTGDRKMGRLILNNSERLVSAMVQPGQNQTRRTVRSSAVDLSLQTVTSESSGAESLVLSAKGNTMKMDLKSRTNRNNGSVAAAFMTLNGMEILLSHQYFKTENSTEMFSDVITAILPSINNIRKPINLTIHHKKALPESGLVTCVYWKEKTEETEMLDGGETETMLWSAEGCWVEYSSENYTVCSCSHLHSLSTFALILQTTEPPSLNRVLELLNKTSVIIGLFFFALAILTFLLGSWNPKINNTARLHLCINLAVFNLLLLWNDAYVKHKLTCRVMAGLFHFLTLTSFVWMLLEALQFHMLIRKLSKVQVIQKNGLPKLALYLIGYGVPLVVVGVSGVVNPDGYGSGSMKIVKCWLSEERNFFWAVRGPMITVLAINFILFTTALWNLRPTLASMNSDISKSKDTKLMMFKILAQYVVLDWTWILSMWQNILFCRVLFIFLSSQQGTVLFIVHCLLNKEVREDYKRWLTWSVNKARERGAA